MVVIGKLMDNNPLPRLRYSHRLILEGSAIMASSAQFRLSFDNGYEVLDGPSLADLKKFKHKQDCHDDAGTLAQLEPTRMSFTVKDDGGKKHKIVIRVTELMGFDAKDDEVIIVGWHLRLKVEVVYAHHDRYGVMERKHLEPR